MLLEVDDLSVGFGALAVTQSISFAIARGERFGVIGESGSGKSMTAMAIAGLLPERAWKTGSVRMDGQDLPREETPMARLRGQRMGFVFQEPMTALNPLMRVGRQIAEAVALTRPEAEMDSEVAALLAEVGLDATHGRRFPHQISGGQRQRAMIAMALASRPDLLIADEPTSALDSITQKRVLDLIREVCERRGTALLFISHDLKAVASLCTRVMVMHRGRAVETGAVAEVFGRPRAEYTRRLVAASRPLVHERDKSAAGGELLAVRDLTRRFRNPGGTLFRPAPELTAVDAVSLTVGAGESVALVGPSGCGKTTLSRMIVGLDRASSGDIVFAGRRYDGDNLPPALRRDITLVFQDPFGSFNPRMRVGHAIAEPLRLEGALPLPARAGRVAESIEAVGLSPDMANRYPHEFSGGQRQRLAIARALVTRPRLVVLDEPVSALDMSVRGEVLDLLARLRADFGLAFLIVSHDLDMVRAVADRVLIMSAGRIVEDGAPHELFVSPRHPLTRELVAARLPEIAPAAEA